MVIKKKLDECLLWELSPVLFSKDFEKGVGERFSFNPCNDVFVYFIRKNNEIVSFCFEEVDGTLSSWTYDYTIKSERGKGYGDLCFKERSSHARNATITVREDRVGYVSSYGLKPVRNKGQWVTMAR